MSRYPVRALALFLVLLASLALAAVPARAVDIQRVVSPGGIEAWLVEDRSLPIIALSFSMPGGAANDPAGKEGLSNMASATLDEGAGDLDSQAFRRRLEDLSVSLSFRDGLDTFGGSLKTLTRNRDAAFELLRLSLTAPRFDEEAVERIRAQILTGIASRAKDPGRLAQRTFWSAVFPGHPYGRARRGTEESVAGITREDLRDFADRRLARRGLIVGVAGDISPAELAPLLDRTFGGLPEEGEISSIPSATPQAVGEVLVVEQPVPQSAILFGQPGLKRDDPDYYTAYLLNHILGGGSFTSRLYGEIREKRGLAYSVYSYLLPLDHAALWMGGAGTSNASVALSLDLVRAEWAQLRDNGVTEEQLAAARDNVNGRFALQLDSTSSIAGMLVAIQRENLGIDYIDKRSSYYAAVTLDDMRRVARKVLDPDALTMVIVGQPEGLDSARRL